MEVLLIALLALGKTHRSQAAFVPEPDKFQPLDQQALRQLYRAKDESPIIAKPYPAQQAAKLSAVYPPPVPFNSQIFWRSVRFLKKSQ